MKNINKKLIVLGLEILAILALGLATLPIIASAQNSTQGYNYTYTTTLPPQSNPVPTIDALTPNSSNVGVGTKNITINGSGFTPSSIVRLNGGNRRTNFIDSFHLMVQITGNDTSAYLANGGFYITVYNGAPGGGFSNAAFFTINNSAANVNTPNYTYDPYANTATTPDNFTDINPNQNPNPINNPITGENLASSSILGSNSFLPSGMIQWVLFAIIILLIIIFIRRIFGAREKYMEAPMKHE